MKNILNLLMLASLTISPMVQASQINEIDERLTDLEIKSLAHKLDFGMELHMFGGYLDRENTQDSENSYSSEHFKNNFRLKVKADIHRDFKAYASLQASYLFNDEVQTNNQPSHSIITPTQGSLPYIRTAYFDWNISKSLTFSAGRLPTTFGPPEHMKHGRARLGTYPLASFNLPLDGLSLTYKLPSLERTKFYTRTIYIPGSITSSSDPQDGAKINATSSDFLENHEGITQMFEAKYDGRNSDYISSMLFIAQYSYLRIGSFKELTEHPYVEAAGKKVLTRVYTDKDTLSYLRIMTGYLEFRNLMKSPFDFYYSFMRSTHNNVSSIYTQVDSSVVDETQFITEGDGQGTRSIYGSRYNLVKSFVGAEYWKTTGSPVPNDLYTDDFIALGQIAGETFHLYYTHLFYSGDISLRFGAVRINEDKNFEDVGYTESNDKITSLYSSIFISY